MAVAMNTELLALRDAGCRSIQIEEPCFHFMANTYGKDHDEVKFYLDCYNREVQGLDDVELWIHTCWGNPNMQRVIDNDSYAASLDMYMSQARGDVWTIETKDRNMREIELLAPYMKHSGKKVCVGVVSHRRLQVETPEEVADSIRLALRHIPAERLIISTDCGFGRQGCNRDIAFFKSVSIAQGTNIVRRELGLPATRIPAADPLLQTDLVPDKPV
jgi:5-methyltetrahydropteroyltriglutamate--homocysteine methyltransferase